MSALYLCYVLALAQGMKRVSKMDKPRKKVRHDECILIVNDY